MTTLFQSDAARIVAGAVTLAEALTVTLSGPRSVLVGDASPIMAMLSGRAEAVAGSVRVLGGSRGDRTAMIGLAPCDPPMLLDLTPLDVVTWSLRLAGLEEEAARAKATRAVELAGLRDIGDRPLARLGLPYRRLTVLAAAAATEPALLVAELPLEGLEAAAGNYVLAGLGRLVGDSAAIVSVRALEPGSPSEALAKGADETITLEGGLVVTSVDRSSAPG